MPPKANSSAPVKDKDKRVHSFIEFSRDLQTRLSDLRTPDDIDRSIDQARDEIGAISKCTLRSPGTRRHEQLDHAGLELWNVCTRVRRREDSEPNPGLQTLVVLSRAFAFLMLSLAQWGDHNVPGDVLRLAKIAIKAGRLCVEGSEFKLALQALQKAADYIGSLQKMRDELPGHEAKKCKELEAEYLVLRIVLSWKEGRLDVSEHLYGKAETLAKELDTNNAENFADALFEIGKHAVAKKEFDLATKWLQRAYDFMNSQDMEKCSRDAIELKLAISQALVQAFIGLNTPEGVQKAENYVSYIESDIGEGKLIVLLLRLEILSKAQSEVFDSQAYGEVIRKMVRSLDITDSTFALIIHHTRKLDDKKPSLACQILEEFLKTRVIPSKRDGWIEKLVVLRTYMSTNRRDTEATVQGLKDVLDTVQANMEKPLSADPAIAILMLLWKRVDSNYTQGQLNLAEKWCQLAAHPLLEQSGPLNAAKIARKMFLCALQRHDLDGAAELFHSMNETTRNQPMTLYLAYKLALQSGNRDLATECLELITASSAKDPKFLYACCLDAQKTGDKLCVLEALRQLAKNHEFNHLGPVHLPALLRVMIRLQFSFIADPDLSHEDKESSFGDMCATLELVVAILGRDPRNQDGTKLFSVAELDWFCKNAYNLALKHADGWDLRKVVRMFSACIEIIAHYPEDMPAAESADLRLRKMFCSFMIATSLAALARSEDNIETRLQNYLTMRKHVQDFDQTLENQMSDMDEDHLHDMREKLAVLLLFDFEGAICLKAWDDLGNIARKSADCQDAMTLQAMADCILRAKSPVQVLYSTLRTIINQLWKIEKFEIDKFAKYLRCLLQATLSHDEELPLSIIQETCNHVKDAAAKGRTFPSIELEWFSTTAFNHGVDLWERKEDELSKKWLSHALSLAHFLKDGGQLEKTLQDRHSHLTFDS